MRSDLQEALVRDFPDLYSRRLEPVDRMNLMPDGILCGDGWEPILRRLSENLSREFPEVRLLGVCENGGVLSVYPGPTRLEVHEAIRKAMTESAQTCEKCGKPGQHRFSSFKTYCDRCAGGPEKKQVQYMIEGSGNLKTKWDK